MLYFSQLIGKKIYTLDQVEVGYCEDLVFIPLKTPKITKLIVRSIRKEKYIIPLDYCIKINHSIFIDKCFNTVELIDNELIIGKHLLGRAIIDQSDSKVKRINNIALQDNMVNEKPMIYMVGFDTGVLGTLRFYQIGKIVDEILKIFDHKVTKKLIYWPNVCLLDSISS